MTTAEALRAGPKVQPAAVTTLRNVAEVRAAIGGDCRPADATRRLIGAGLDGLPAPGSGRTLERWRALAAVGATDLALAKLFEGHTDALAILAELAPDRPRQDGAMWSVWAAEGAGTALRVVATPPADGPGGGVAVLAGVKPWCSGAQAVSHALVTAFTADQRRQLFAVDMASAGIRVDDRRWQAVGMASSESADVHFDGVVARAVSEPDAYFRRPGFAHGGAGIAACWMGAAAELARTLLGAGAAASPEAQALRAVASGRVALALGHSAGLLLQTAADIDSRPQADLQDAVRLLRLSVDQTARQVLDECLRSLGPTPFCRNPALARLAADLPIFLRQCHGEADLLEAGRAFRRVAAEDGAWPF